MSSETGANIGILGGTFNPVHMGHLLLAQAAAEACDLSTVLFIPCAMPPHKGHCSLASAEHRLAMLEAATEGNLRFEVCDLEVRRGGPSYTIDTIRQLRGVYPGSALHFIIGADTLTELHLWKDIRELLNLCRFVTLVRPGSPVEQIKPEDLGLDPPWPERLLKDVCG
ncbi:MAG: nicotinate (nicotinamide) nucleotide adenylyltransferase, partial [Lentisphaerae bacterium]|nr:nicotinate (nicotinamide) nucleotide adenylyltransferase [Lentisphaerota bacterium]